MTHRDLAGMVAVITGAGSGVGRAVALGLAAAGGTGMLLCQLLREDGHEPLAASPDTGVNTITGEGLAEA